MAIVAAQGFDPSIKVDPLIKSPQPWEYMSNDELPKEYDPYISLAIELSIVVILMVFPTSLSTRTSIFLNIVVLVGLSLLLLLFLIV